MPNFHPISVGFAIRSCPDLCLLNLTRRKIETDADLDFSRENWRSDRADFLDQASREEPTRKATAIKSVASPAQIWIPLSKSLSEIHTHSIRLYSEHKANAGWLTTLPLQEGAILSDHDRSLQASLWLPSMCLNEVKM